MIQALLDALSRKGNDVAAFDIDGVKHVAVPDGIKLQRLDLEAYLPQPKAIRRTVSANDVRGLIDYVNKFKDDSTQLYASHFASPSVTARMDDHMPGVPSHQNHTCTFGCAVTKEWQTWMSMDAKAMEQKTFGAFLETNAIDILSPAASEVIRLATEFRTVTMVEVGSTVRLKDGQTQINYVEKDQPGQVVMPDSFKLGLTVFEGTNKRYPLDARLRYRVTKAENGAPKLMLHYELDRPDIVQRQAYDDLLLMIEEKVDGKIFRAL